MAISVETREFSYDRVCNCQLKGFPLKLVSAQGVEKIESG